MKQLILFLLSISLLFACKNEEDDNPVNNTSEAQMSFKFNFDEDQERLNNLGQPAAIPQGHAAQTPEFQKLSVHLIELAPDQWTIPGQGFSAYKGAETTEGGSNAVDFDQAILEDENIIFKTIDIKEVPPGTYEYIRVSVSYQLYDIKFNILNVPIVGDLMNQSGRVASFLGFNNYINSVTPKQLTQAVNANKKQGYWVFESDLSAPYNSFNQLYSGEAPEGATTVVNPLAGITDIPIGSCIVTGKFETPLVITGDEEENITINLSFSVNDSFEWVDLNGNGELDLDADASADFENIVDMGLRGLIPSWTK